MDVRKHHRLLAASVAGILAAFMGGLAQQAQAQSESAEGENVHCYGVNKCKGSGDCGGKGHGCAGMNACKGQAFIDLSKDDCLRIEGGRLTAEVEEQGA